MARAELLIIDYSSDEKDYAIIQLETLLKNESIWRLNRGVRFSGYLLWMSCEKIHFWKIASTLNSKINPSCNQKIEVNSIRAQCWIQILYVGKDICGSWGDIMEFRRGNCIFWRMTRKISKFPGKRGHFITPGGNAPPGHLLNLTLSEPEKNRNDILPIRPQLRLKSNNPRIVVIVKIFSFIQVSVNAVLFSKCDFISNI